MVTFEKPNDQVASELDHDVQLLKHQVPVLSNPDETGWDRLRQMYSRPRGHLSPELNIVLSTATTGATVGFLLAGFNFNKQAKEAFIRQNKHQMFFDARDFQRKLLDYRFLLAIRGGAKVGWRVGLLSGLYMLGALSGSVYREKFGVLEHVVGGGIGAAVYRCHLGLRGMFLGSIIGMTLGLVGGTLTMSMTRMLGLTLAQVRYDYYQEFMGIWDEEDKKRLEQVARRVLKEEEEERNRV